MKEKQTLFDAVSSMKNKHTIVEATDENDIERCNMQCVTNDLNYYTVILDNIDVPVITTIPTNSMLHLVYLIKNNR